MLTDKEKKRYNRHILLPEIGLAGQEKIKNSSVLIIGAGGLGCPILQYLAATGVGCIGIIDFDTISETNLQRQVLYNSNEIDKYKVDIAVQKLSRQNPYVKFTTYCYELTNKNALELFQKYDIIIDGTDNFSSRYLINDACAITKKPLIYGAIHKFEGQVAVFHYAPEGQQITTDYRDLFPEPPENEQAPNCSEAGVIGVLPGIIGTMQACEAIKIITGIGNPLSEELLIVNSLNMDFYKLKITPNAKRESITSEKFENYNYKQFCGIENTIEIKEITCENFKIEIKNNRKGLQIIDIRDPSELPKSDELIDKQIPIEDLIDRINEIEISKKVILVCKTGVRSKLAIRMLQKKISTNNFYSLKGGIIEWLNNNKV
ncbi:MAG: HesA/MoeB/ThiF family protein [Bacteroidia bacterium]|nr:HesA/MoeB/ThiF family protein [Bacteroidia bacterium]